MKLRKLGVLIVLSFLFCSADYGFSYTDKAYDELVKAAEVSRDECLKFKFFRKKEGEICKKSESWAALAIAMCYDFQSSAFGKVTDKFQDSKCFERATETLKFPKKGDERDTAYKVLSNNIQKDPDLKAFICKQGAGGSIRYALKNT